MDDGQPGRGRTARHRALLAIESTAVPAGNGAHITVPKDWIGRRFLVIELLDRA